MRVLDQYQKFQKGIVFRTSESFCNFKFWGPRKRIVDEIERTRNDDENEKTKEEKRGKKFKTYIVVCFSSYTQTHTHTEESVQFFGVKNKICVGLKRTKTLGVTSRLTQGRQ